ncbi:hypothetical protein BH23GEM6_BH23GEM6_27690 [soil metagenome]
MLLLVLALHCLFGVVPAQAQARTQTQGTSQPDRLTLIGHVVDGATGVPLPGAIVELQELERRVLTDQRGRFLFTDLPRGEHRATVRQLGYQDYGGSWRADRDPTTLTVALGSRPIVLEGVTVDGFTVARELQARRFSRGDGSQAISRDELAMSAGMDVRQLIAQRRSLSMRHNTRNPPAPAIYIDEFPSCWEDLEMYDPDQIYQIEIYGGRNIRVYTIEYIERLGRTNRKLPALNLLARGRGC